MKNTVRITSGILKGRNLKFFPNDSLRPTKNIVVEALGSILNQEFQDTKCLDLFCGSGLVGLHFYSWGASQVHLIDNHKITIKELQKQIKQLQCEEQVKAYCNDVQQFLDKNKSTYDIIYLDPPYQLYEQDTYSLELEPVIKKASENTKIICIEMPFKTKIELSFLNDSFEMKNYKYGSATLIIGKRKTDR